MRVHCTNLCCRYNDHSDMSVLIHDELKYGECEKDRIFIGAFGCYSEVCDVLKGTNFTADVPKGTFLKDDNFPDQEKTGS